MKTASSQREPVLKASREYYAHRAYYNDLLSQRVPQYAKTTQRELDFVEYAFQTHAAHPVKDVLDVACGGGRHIIGLAHRGYRCTGQDYTPERVEVAKLKAKRESISVKLQRGDATRLKYREEFDAAIALYILFLLPSDVDVQKTLQGIYRSLRPGGILVCNIFNPFNTTGEWADVLYRNQHLDEIQAPGIRDISISRLMEFDQIHGVAWIQETDMIEAPDGRHLFRDKERVRLFTYWDLHHYLQSAGFREIECYPDMKTKPSRQLKARELAFVARKQQE